MAPPLAPVRRYRVEPPRRRGVGRILLVAVAWLFVAVLVVAAGLAGGAYLYLEEGVAQALTPRDAQVIAASETLDAVPAGEPAVALAIGYDRRLGAEGEVNGARSDTIMLLRADPETKSVSMLSFPRDLARRHPLPGEGRSSRTGSTRPTRSAASRARSRPSGTSPGCRSTT